MRRTILLAACTCVCACSNAWAQPPADCTANALNIPGAPYPCIFPDHRVANLDKFAYIGGFSGSTGGRGGFDPKTSNGGVFADAAALNKKVKLMFLGIGSVEGPGTKTFSEQLTQAGITNVYFESPGTAHEWLTWRRCLREFAPRLFR